jgi:ATP-dependent Lon protease
MTGEITLTGRILPVAGIQDKVLAARRAMVKTVLVPARNRADVQELSEDMKKGIEIRLVDTVAEVVDSVLTGHQ